ncbi:MAG: radical SAM protein [Candidatus Omnitrophica bacterium]|nr:radical SAM protein [Candidatus Omnitrophota bacterium]MDD5352463.1 radical SAM protein [Candidatus Omnitrophota bacterium]MDD5550061.1 radical SAM protein [Candidatus Omnitrophota bacterium]
MKIIFTYPPLDKTKGTPLLSQNRQFQYFKEPTYIYPVVPACAATLLKEDGFDILWKDCIAKNIEKPEFYEFIQKESPDIIAMETKTPVVKQHWKIIDEIKKQNPKIKVVLCGDHVTALPEESMRNSQVDFILTGGDYDFLLLNLCRVLKDGGSYDSFEPGIYYRNNAEIKNSGQFILNHNLDGLPFIDRELTNWKLYAFKNGNFKRTPGTYIMSGRDCWWGKCKFCSWPTLYPQFRARTPVSVLDEIDMLVEKYRVREIMDDTGTFPVGKWLVEFCEGMMNRRLNRKVNIDCNMRFGVLGQEEYAMMKKAGFRLVLFGLESANQKTLDKINKNLNVQDIIKSCKMAKAAGLYPHITIMFGYPWETYEDALKTLELGRWLLKKGIAYTVQATIVIPYPGSKLFEECKSCGELTSQDWDDYDMKNPVMKTAFDKNKMSELVYGIYSVAYNPEFILRRMMSIRDANDIKYFFRGFKKVIGHIFDFK